MMCKGYGINKLFPTFEVMHILYMYSVPVHQRYHVIPSPSIVHVHVHVSLQ